MFDNIILLSDSYKVSHYVQYPKNTEKVYSYFESRGGKFDEVVFFGLQYYLKKYLEGSVVTEEKVKQANDLWGKHFSKNLFNYDGWMHIVEKHDGKLPVRIKAVPEGSVVQNNNVLMTIENTDPKCYWLTNFLETLLVQTWYASTVATLSREMKKTIHKYLEMTGNTEGIDFKLHDFGFRGVSSVESAAVGGAAHLVNFKGTDTMAGALCAMEYYKSGMPGYSIPASEHSTITAWGKNGELDAYENMLDQYPDGLVACVSDSYDIYNACRELWGGKLKNKVLSRDGTLVVRPDSGYPPDVVVEVLSILGKQFGYTLNSKGFAVLPPQVRVIQGDGIDYEMTKDILFNMKYNGWSADNIAFGMGGGLLQKLNRDTQKFAFKCSNVTVDGEDRMVFKEPVTDSGKKSKKGRLRLVRTGKLYNTLNQPGPDEMQTVFENGEILVEHNFNEIRERAKL